MARPSGEFDVEKRNVEVHAPCRMQMQRSGYLARQALFGIVPTVYGRSYIHR